MGEQDGGYNAWPPIGAPLLNIQREDQWRHYDNSVNAVSFGFVATAILISMFLVMAIFERFLRPSGSGRSNGGDLESQRGFNAKLGYPSPKMSVYANGVSVLMPGDNVPTFIAHPAPAPCPPEPPICCHRQPPMSSSSNQETVSNGPSNSSSSPSRERN